MKKIISAILALCMLLSLAACGKSGKPEDTSAPAEQLTAPDAPATVPSAGITSGELPIEHETKFGGVYVCATIEEFLDFGFMYGDSVDVVFSNGYKVENIPFYDGYYTRNDDPLLCAYPGYPYVKVCFNNGADMFTVGELTEDCTAVITLRERGKFLSVQGTMSMVYTDAMSGYSSDEVFANFREMSVGNLKAGLFYRSASPCDDQHNRASFASALAEKAGIGYVLDLADNEDEIKGYYESDTDCPYWKTLYENGKVLPLDMASNYRADVFAAKTAQAMRAVLTEEGPFLIHCTEGKDRTGFVCILVEALAGADVSEIEKDYMITYDNYYGVTKESDPDGYNAVRELRFCDMIMYLCGCSLQGVDDLTPEDLIFGAEEYLKFGGMTADEIGTLEEIIRK